MKTARPLTASLMARHAGVSVKTLRVYETRGLITPERTAAGWRIYGNAEIRRVAEILDLRALGLGLGEIAEVLNGGPPALERALAVQRALTERGLRDRAEQLAAIRRRLGTVGREGAAQANDTIGESVVRFDLPWPWDGEHFELASLPKLTFITGPLGSGKTRLARKIAAELPGAIFLDSNRRPIRGANGSALDAASPAGAVDVMIDRIIAREGSPSEALAVLIAAIASPGPSALVVDMVEDGLDEATQRALMAVLRDRAAPAMPLVLMTRSSAILDLEAMGPDEMIVYCPANHDRPLVVRPVPGYPGLEMVASCVASPAARARTAGVIAVRPTAA